MISVFLKTTFNYKRCV